MSEKLIIINDAAGLIELVDYLSDFEYVAFDTETTGVSSSAEIIGFSVCAEENRAFYVILSYWSPEEQKLIYTGLKQAALQVMELLVSKKLIMHNCIFDCRVVERDFKVSLIDSIHTDTMILAHLLNENRPVGLKLLGALLYGSEASTEQAEMKASVTANGGTLTKDNYELYKADALLLAKYGAKDALLTYKLFNDLVIDLYEQGLEKFFYEDESMPLLRGPSYDLNTTGVKVDQDALLRLKKQLEAECSEAKDFITKEIAKLISHKYPGTTKKNHFNMGSTQQLAWLLFGEIGLEFHTLTDSGKEVCRHFGMKTPYTFAQKRVFIDNCEMSKGDLYLPDGKKAKKIKDPWAYLACDKEALSKHADKIEWVKVLLSYQKKQKILNTYVKGIESRVEYGILRPSFLLHGTTSGRFSSRDPNLQNLPRDDQRVKECLVARPGKVFVGADYSQLEPRVFAYMSGDERLKAAFGSGNDFYSTIGMEVYGKIDALPIKDGHPDAFGIKYKKLRDLSKVIALASTYGATAYQLMKTTGKNAEDTQMDIDNYFESFPGVAKMMLDSHEIAKSEGQVANLFGRLRRMPEAKTINSRYGNAPHKELPYEIRNILNLAVNHRIQSTGASIVNRAMVAFYNDCITAGLEVKLVSQIHDELIAECREEDAENVALLLQNAMENTVLLEGVPLEAIPRITRNLAK